MHAWRPWLSGMAWRPAMRMRIRTHHFAVIPAHNILVLHERQRDGGDEHAVAEERHARHQVEAHRAHALVDQRDEREHDDLIGQPQCGWSGEQG